METERFNHDCVEGNLLSTYKKQKIVHYNEYDHVLCAVFALKFSINQNVEDFEMTAKDGCYASFNDIALKVKYRDKTSRIFLIKISHPEEETKDFNIINILKNFREIEENNICIFHTTQHVATALSTADEECETIIPRDLNTGTAFSIEIKQFGQNLQKKVFILTNQPNLENLKLCIETELRQLLAGEEIHSTFIKFMENWWSGNFILRKKDVIAKIAEIALTPVIREISDKNCNEKTKFLTEAIMKFEMTLVEDAGSNIVETIWQPSASIQHINAAALKYGLSNEETKNIHDLSLLKRTKVLWYLNQVPLIVKIDNSQELDIKNVIKLLAKCEQKMKLLLVGNVSRDDFFQWKIFENLSDLIAEEVYEDIIQEFRMSLQNKPPFSLKQLMNVVRDTNTAVETRQLLEMSQQVLVIDSIAENLPSDYIPRSVSASFFNTKKLLNNYELLKNDLVIIFNYDKNQCKKLIKLNNVEIVELSDYRWLIHPHNEDRRKKKSPLVVLTDKCNDFQFDEICEATEKQNVYVVQIVDEECCKLIMGKQSTNKSEELCIEESKIHSFCQAPINVLCSPAGMGKSTMMTFLAKNCPPDLWTIRVDLKDHERFFKKQVANEEVLPYFLKLDQNDGNCFTSRIKSSFLKSARICLFLDGLNEIDSNSVDFVLAYVKYVSSTGVRVWLSSRELLKEKIKTRLSVFPMDIKEVNTEQQKQYLQKRLGDKYELDKVIKIEQLGIPLQLYMLSEVGLNVDRFYEKLSQEPVILQIYKAFFNRQNNDLEQYEYPALAACLESDTLQKLELEMNKCETFLEQIRDVGDKFGVINHFNDEGHAVFVHQTYAEYFAALWMSKNFDKVRLVGDEFFEEKYRDLRKMFDIILSERCPLHLAIIYKNPEQIKKYLGYSSMKDKGSRNALHLFCSYSMTSQEIINDLSDFDPSETDSVFQWNCLDYAAATESLFSVELLLKRFGDSVNLEHLNQRFDDDTLAFHACKFGYPNLLAAVLRQNTNIVSFLNESFLLHVAVNEEAVIADDCPMRNINTLKIIDILIRNGADVNLRDSNGATALHYASKFGLKDAVTTLLAHKADVHATTEIEETVLHYALLEEPNLGVVKLLVETGVDVNAKDKDGNTPLHLAAARRSREAVKILIESGADIKATSRLGETVLHAACSDGSDVEIVKVLLGSTIDINTKDHTGQNALHMAAKGGNYEVVKLLIEKGCDVKARTRLNETVLHHVFKKKPNLDVVELLLENNVDLNVTNADDLTALHLAVAYGNYEIVKLLIDKNADIEAISNMDLTILHHAVLENAEEEIIKLLLESGADINAKDRHGKNVLHLAVEARNCRMVQTLIEEGASVNAMTYHSETVLTYTIKKYPNLEIITLLLNKEIDVNMRNAFGVTALHEAASMGDYQIAKSLIEKGAQVDIVDHSNFSILHYAARAEQPNLQVIKLILKQGANANAKTNNGETALHLVAKSGNYDVIKALIENGSDVKAVTFSNKSVLHYALEGESDVKLIKLLLDSGIDPNAKDMDEISVLHLAAYSGNYEIVKTLLQRGSDVKATTSFDKTALHYAFAGNTNTEVVKLLLECGVDVNQVDDHAESALYLAAVRNNELLKVLIDKGGNVKTKTVRNETVLHNLISNGDPTLETVELLLNNGVDIDAEDNDGVTALHFAVRFGYHDIVQTLLGKNADANAVTCLNESVFYYSVKYETSLDTIKLLLDSGADYGKKDDDGVTPLHLAAEQGSYETLKLLIDAGADVNVTTCSNEGVLHYAFNREPDLEVITLLLDSGCDVNLHNDNGVVVLHLAVEKGDCEVVEILLKNGADVSAVTHSNKTVLHYATEGKSVQIVDLLLRSGVDVDARNEDGETALHLATQSGNFDLVQALIDHGAQLSAKTYTHKTVLHYLFEGEPDLQILQLLLDRNVDINAQDIDGVSALHLAAKSDNLEFVNVLIEKGADVTARTRSNETVMHYGFGNAKIVEVFLNRGVAINVGNDSGVTALHLAVTGKNNDVVDMLIAKGADLRAITYYSETVLDYALRNKPKVEFVKLLLRNGVDPNVQDAKGSTALHQAVNRGYCNVVEVLLQNGANINTSTYANEPLLHSAIRRSNVDIVRLLLNKKCNLHEKDGEEVALHRAIKKGNYEIVKILLESGADVKTRKSDGETLLHYAIRQQPYLDVIKLLLNHGIAPSIQDEEGVSPLHLAVQIGNLEIVQALIEKGANLEAITSTKATVLHFAVNCSANTDVVKILLDNGLDINATNRDKVSVLHLAAENGNYAIMKLLIERGGDVTAVTDLNDTVLHYALRKCEPNKEIVKLLLENGVDVNAKNYSNVACLHLAAEKGNLKILKMLVENGGDVKAITDTRETVLHYALKSKPSNVDVIKLLLDNNVDIKREACDGETALHLAAQAGNCDIVKMLIEKGADLTALTDSKETVLHYALTEKPNVDIIKMLVDNNVDVNKRDYNGVTALHLAVHWGNRDIVKILIKRGAILVASNDSNESVLHYVFKAESPNTDIFMLLMDNDVNVNEEDEDGVAPLHLAAEAQNYEMMKTLIEKGAVVDESVLPHVFKNKPSVKILNLLSGLDLNWKDDEGHGAIHFAIRKENYDIVKYLLEKGVDLKAVDASNRSILHFAFCECSNVGIIKLLLNHEVDVNLEDDAGRTPLHEATKNGTYEMVKILVEKGANVKALTKKKQTIVNYSYDTGLMVEPAPEIVDFLAEKGMDLDGSDEKGISVLHNAAANNHYNVVKILIEKGANVQSVTSQNDTVLNYGCQSKEFNVEVAKLLIDNGVNINMANCSGKGPLENAFVNERYNVVKLLRRFGAICHKKEVNEAIGLFLYNAPTDGDTLASVFFWAAENGCTALMEFAINKGAPINLYAIVKTQELDWSLLHKLLGAGADVNAKDPDGVTALHWACQYSHNSLVDLLLDKGADNNATTKTKETPLHYAVRGWDTVGTKWIIELLSSKGNLDVNAKDQNGVTPLHLAALVRNVYIVDALVDCGADIGAVTNDEESVLHFAVKAWKNNLDLIKDLMRSKGANVNAVDKNGVSALHIAAAKGDFEVVEVLLEHGATVNATDCKKRTALHHVAEKWIKNGNAVFEGRKICQDSPAVLELLFKFGIDVNAADEDGLSCLHLAANKGHYDLMEKLIEHGADINALTKKGESVLDYAVNSDKSSERVLKLIQQGVEKTAARLQSSA